MHVRLPGVQLRGLAHFGHGFRQFVFQLERQSQIVMQRCILRGELKRCLEFRNGSVEIRHLQMCRAQVASVSAVVGAQTDCGLEFSDGAVAVACLQEGQPKIIVRVGILRLQFHRLAKCFDGLLHLATVLKQQAQAVLRVRVI